MPVAEKRFFKKPFAFVAYFVTTRAYGPTLFFAGLAFSIVLTLRASVWFGAAAAAFCALFLLAALMGGIVLARYPRPGQSARSFARSMTFSNLGRDPLAYALIAGSAVCTYFAFVNAWWALGAVACAGILWLAFSGITAGTEQCLREHPSYAHYGFQKKAPDPGI